GVGPPIIRMRTHSLTSCLLRRGCWGNCVALRKLTGLLNGDDWRRHRQRDMPSIARSKKSLRATPYFFHSFTSRLIVLRGPKSKDFHYLTASRPLTTPTFEITE